MAVYEYRCEECDETFTVRERISQHDDEKLDHPVCPHCDSERTIQQFVSFYAKTSVKS